MKIYVLLRFTVLFNLKRNKQAVLCKCPVLNLSEMLKHFDNSASLQCRGPPSRRGGPTGVERRGGREPFKDGGAILGLALRPG